MKRKMTQRKQLTIGIKLKKKKNGIPILKSLIFPNPRERKLLVEPLLVRKVSRKKMI